MANAYPVQGYRKGSPGFQRGKSRRAFLGVAAANQPLAAFLARRALQRLPRMGQLVITPYTGGLSAMPRTIIPNPKVAKLLGGIRLGVLRTGPGLALLAAAAAAVSLNRAFLAEKGPIEHMPMGHHPLSSVSCGDGAGGVSPIKSTAACPTYQDCCYDDPLPTVPGPSRMGFKVRVFPPAWIYGAATFSHYVGGAPAAALHFAPSSEYIIDRSGLGSDNNDQDWDSVWVQRYGPRPVHVRGKIDLDTALPQLDPFSQPPFVRQPQPVTIPWRWLPLRKPNPSRSPTESPTRGPEPEVIRPKPPLPQPQPQPKLRPSWRLSSRTSVDGAGNRNITRDPTAAHKSAPPGKGVKEKKFTASVPAGVNRLLRGVTEGIDFIDAIHAALPLSFQDHHTPQGKLRDIYMHINDVDMQQALINLFREKGEDRFYGKLGKLSAKAARRLRLSKGVQLGPAL